MVGRKVAGATTFFAQSEILNLTSPHHSMKSSCPAERGRDWSPLSNSNPEEPDSIPGYPPLEGVLTGG